MMEMTTGGMEIVPSGKSAVDAPLKLYGRMQAAIAKCYKIDECQNIATQAGAIAAYYKQIKDDRSVKNFLQIKIRAWRRIGEIIIGSGVDRSACETQAEYIRQIRAVLKEEVEEIHDFSIRQAIRIGEVDKDFFDRNVGRHSNLDSLINAFAAFQRCEWEATPEGRSHVEAMKRENAKRKKEEEKREAERETERREQQRQRDEEARSVRELMSERDDAFREVGITLDRRDRKQMHQIVFLLKEAVHEILRQAAFDHRVTMQSILRSGLLMWFIAHGYTVSAEDMNIPERPSRSGRKK